MSRHLQPFLDGVRRGVEAFSKRSADADRIEGHYRQMRSIQPWARDLLVRRELAALGEGPLTRPAADLSPQGEVKGGEGLDP